MTRGSHPFDSYALHKARHHANLSLSQLANLVGTTKAQIIRYESGSARPEPGRLAQLARALKTSALTLIGTTVEQATLTELRAAAGLTAAATAEALGMSRSTYRILEHEGRYPHGRERVVEQLACVLGTLPGQIRTAVARTPAVEERRLRLISLTEELTELLWSPYAEPAVEHGSERIAALADIAGQPVEQVQRLMAYLLDLGRGHVLRHLGSLGEAAYAQTARQRVQARRRSVHLRDTLKMWPDVLVEALDWLSDALTSKEWRSLVRVARAEHDAVPGVPVADGRELTALLSRCTLLCPGVPAVPGPALPASPRTTPARTLARVVAVANGPRIRLSPRGSVYGRASAPLYAFLHPQVDASPELFNIRYSPKDIRLLGFPRKAGTTGARETTPDDVSGADEDLFLLTTEAAQRSTTRRRKEPQLNWAPPVPMLLPEVGGCADEEASATREHPLFAELAEDGLSENRIQLDGR